MARREGMIDLDAWDIGNVVAYAALALYSLVVLALRCHKSRVLRTFVVISFCLGALRTLEILVYYDLDESLEAWYLAFVFLLSLSPAIFLAQFALIVRTWADALYSVAIGAGALAWPV